MLIVPGKARLFLYQYPMSMRKSFESLSAAIEELFPGELYSGTFFIFLNRRKDHIKIFSWDGDGFEIYLSDLREGRIAGHGVRLHT